MRSAAFAVEATLVFLASRINEKIIKINSNCSAAFAAEATFLFLAPRRRVQGWRVGGLRSSGFGFSIKVKKNYKMKPSKNPCQTIQKQWFSVLKLCKMDRSRVAPQPSLALARAKSPLRGGRGVAMNSSRLSRAEGVFKLRVSAAIFF